MQVAILAIAGGSGSGKSTLARRIASRIGPDRCLIVSQDNYYIDQSEQFDEDGGEINFDHPAALEFSLLAIHLQELRLGKPVEIPVYDFPSHKRMSKGISTDSKSIILVDGTLILSQDLLLPLFDFSIFLDVTSTTRYERRLRRDTIERGRDASGVIKQWRNHVVPMHNHFVEPSMTNADRVIQDEASFEGCIEQIAHRYSELL